ncbi:MAG TPA: ABC transporter permease [Actinomycetota bacterium]|nr:ABC transporter permease [Actinomycetota bacterium]
MSEIPAEVQAGQVPGLAAGEKKVEGRSPGQIFWARFRQDKLALVGLGFVVLLVVIALAAPLITDWVAHDPNDISNLQEATNQFGNPDGPNSEFWFGADPNGRDVFARVIHGTRTTLEIALGATLLSVAIGVVLGIMAGYFGGAIDTLISRLVDIVLSVPLLFFAVGIGAVCGSTAEGCSLGIVDLKPGLFLVMVIVAVFSWPYIARIVRGNTLSIKEKEFIEASRAMGAGSSRIMFKEVLPNLIAPIIVYSTLIIPSNIIFEASLSFLGVGVPDETPSWGSMLDQASQVFETAWWLMLFPGLFLLFTVLAFNLLGDGLRDALDPKQAR